MLFFSFYFQLLSRVGLGPVGVCVIGLQLECVLHSSLIPDNLVGSRPPYDSTVELGWLMCQGDKGRENNTIESKISYVPND